MLVACIGLYGERVEQALVGINRLRPHVDRYVVVIDETVTKEQKQKLREAGCEVYFHKWEDSMVRMRNQYLEKVQTDDWVIVHDPDEVFCMPFCKDARELCMKAGEKNIDLLLINSHDCTIKADGSKDESVSDFFKNLIFRKRDGTCYQGVGEVKEVHETLMMPNVPVRTVRLNKDKYWYEHTKYWHEVWERAARNVFMAGGGNNSGTKNPSWKPLREICDSLGLDNWTKARDYFRKGKIDPQLIKWLWENRTEGWDYEHEELEFGRWYFEYLHPEESEDWKPITEVPIGHPTEVMRYVEEVYMNVLGRHADQEGKEAYMRAIVEGKLRREDFPLILKSSPEYMQREGITPPTLMPPSGEQIRLEVPVNVDVRLSEDLFVQALMRSGVYWEKIRPKLDVGTLLEQELGDKWQEFQKWFYSEKPSVKQLANKLKLLIQGA